MAKNPRENINSRVGFVGGFMDSRIKVVISKMEIVGLLLLPAQLFYLRLVKHACGATKSVFPFFLKNRNVFSLISIFALIIKIQAFNGVF